MKRFILGFALAFFVACDDESSFAPHDEDSSSSVCEDCDDSSSSVKSSSSKKETSSSSSKEQGDGVSLSSSSGQAPAAMTSSSAKSSSSKKETSSSSRHSGLDPESSSTKGDGGSEAAMTSSSAKSSSSVTQQSSSSVNSSSSEGGESSSTITSSSSEGAMTSSSSGYVPYDHMADLGDAIRIKSSDYKTFVDERNGRSYYYITINGKNKKGEAASVTVMAENLNIGKMIFYDDDQANDSKIERFCYDDDTTNCDRYGGLYQWAEMMQLPSRCNTESCADLIQPNHQGICPDGWRLLTQDDFYIVLHADNNKHGIQDARAISFGGFNYSGYSLVGAGYVLNRKLKNIGESAGWFYTEEGVDAPAEGAFVSSTAKTGDIFSTYEMAKMNGLSVRCVKLEE